MTEKIEADTRAGRTRSLVRGRTRSLVGDGGFPVRTPGSPPHLLRIISVYRVSISPPQAPPDSPPYLPRRSSRAKVPTRGNATTRTRMAVRPAIATLSATESLSAMKNLGTGQTSGLEAEHEATYRTIPCVRTSWGYWSESTTPLAPHGTGHRTQYGLKYMYISPSHEAQTHISSFHIFYMEEEM